MPAPLIRKGDRIRLQVCCIDGWKGFGFALEDELNRDPDAVITFRREDMPEDQFNCGVALRSQVARCRQQGGRR